MVVKQFLGEGSLVQLHQILQELGVHRILLVRAGQSFEKCGAAEFFLSLDEEYDISEFADFEENPRFEDVCLGIEILEQVKPEVIIAVGGGTAIDIAKSLSVLSESCEYAKDVILGNAGIKEKYCPVIVAPTTSGTGSEATKFAVVYLDGKKYSIEHDLILPDYVILDPLLTYTLPRFQTAVTGFDAFCQAIESFWSVNSTEESQQYSEDAIRLIKDHLELAVNAPDATNRKQMLIAANLAGKAINIAKTTAPHAISYFITMRYGIPHGHAVALTLAKFIQINCDLERSEINDARGREYVDEMMQRLLAILGCANAVEASALIVRMLKECGLESNLTELGITEPTEKNAIKASVNPARLKNNPVKVNDALLELALDQ